ncbi:CRISPR-associated CARF protein Csa3 [Halobaculum sp. MBLA0147]|uniref:CRISPR-associated CARF protein Csa3 n=1 Tax=Halobaculum sp. MBLA0147 TaxID=3079934 RepID=UPI003523CEB1
MQTFVGPIGYDSTRVTRPVLRHGVTNGDTIRLLHPERPEDDEDARAQEAITDVERMIGELEPSVTVESLPTPTDPFEETLDECLGALDDVDGELVVILGGGVREIYFPLGLAAVTRQEQVDATLQYSDLDGSVQEIDLPPVGTDIGDSVESTLIAIVDAERVSLADLARELDPSKSTISRHLDTLEDAHFVTTSYEGKSKVVEPTRRGKLYLEF